MPQDPTGSGFSSSSSSSDLAESDDRNDEEDDENVDEKRGVAAITPTAGILDRSSVQPIEDVYENVAGDERPLDFVRSNTRDSLYDSRTVSRLVDHAARRSRRYDDFQEQEYIETALTSEPMNGLHDYSSSSANSLDDLCRGHRRMLVDFNRAESTSARDHYMIPTRDPRELNERILSLFNPQFLPNFNDMIMYVTTQCDSRRSPPPRSHSMADAESRFFRSSSHRRKRAGTGSMFFRKGLTYDTARK